MALTVSDPLAAGAPRSAAPFGVVLAVVVLVPEAVVEGDANYIPGSSSDLKGRKRTLVPRNGHTLLPRNGLTLLWVVVADTDQRAAIPGLGGVRDVTSFRRGAGGRRPVMLEDILWTPPYHGSGTPGTSKQD